VAFKATKNPEAAYKWIEWLSAPENMVAFNLGTPSEPGTLLPPKQSLLDDPSLYVNRPYLQASKDSMTCAYVPQADQPNYFKAEEILNEYLGKAFYGEISGAEAVKQAAQEAEPALKE
jgi:multiple sugar transport system substrate-binding protein